MFSSSSGSTLPLLALFLLLCALYPEAAGGIGTGWLLLHHLNGQQPPAH